MRRVIIVFFVLAALMAQALPASVSAAGAGSAAEAEHLLRRAQSADGRIRVEVRVEPAVASPGATFTMTVDVVAPRDVSISLPLPDAEGGAFRIRAGSAPEDVPSGDVRRHRRRFLLDSFAVGLLEVPLPAVLVHHAAEEPERVEVDAITVQVRSVADPGEVMPRDLKEWVEVEGPGLSPSAMLLRGAMISAGLALLAGVLLRMLRKRAVAGDAPQPDPAVRALADLDDLSASGMAEREEFERFHTRLTAILRRYVEDAFNVPALEQTTGEFLRAAAGHAELSRYQSELTALLRAADLVKFAAARSGRDECAAAIASVRTFVKQTSCAEVAA